MRIQDTNAILKESRVARSAYAQEHDDEGTISKVWRMITSIPERIMTLVRRHH